MKKQEVDWRYNYRKYFPLWRLWAKNKVKRRYGYDIPMLNIPEGNNLILCNHVTTYDPFILIAACDKPARVVIAKEFVPLRFRRLLGKRFNPIWKDKNLKDPSVALEIVRTLRKGDSVFLFPEGNRTFSTKLCYIGESIAKLAESGKANIIYVNIVGGLTIDPRFGLRFRKGHIDMFIRGMLKKEDMANMSLEEIHQDICKNLSVEEVPSKYPSVSKKRAEKLERVLYRCPVCHELCHIRSEGNLVKCDACGLEVTYGEHLLFENPNKEGFPHHDLYDWFKEQEDFVRSSTFSPDEIILEEDHVNLEDINLDHEIFLDKDVHISLSGTSLKVGEREFKISDIKEITVSGKQNFIFYVGDTIYRVSSKIAGFNALKYMQVYYRIRHQASGEDDSFLGI